MLNTLFNNVVSTLVRRSPYTFFCLIFCYLASVNDGSFPIQFQFAHNSFCKFVCTCFYHSTEIYAPKLQEEKLHVNGNRGKLQK